MAIDRRHIGFTLAPFTLTVDPEQLAHFGRAIGAPPSVAADPIAPPTFMKVIEGEHGSSRAILAALDIDLRGVLHAEQQFDYITPICAGDRLTVTRTVTDIQTKKGGTLEFLVIESVIARVDGKLAGRSRQVLLVRTPAARPSP